MLEAHSRYAATEGQEGQAADLTLRVVEDFDFSGLDLSQINDPVYAAVFLRCRFVGTDFYYTSFRDVSAPGADFREAILPKAEFWGCDLGGAHFDRANLLRVNFLGCNLRAASFLGADLNLVSFGGSDVEGAAFDEGVVPDTE